MTTKESCVILTLMVPNDHDHEENMSNNNSYNDIRWQQQWPRRKHEQQQQ